MLGSDLARELQREFAVVGISRKSVDYLSIPYAVCDLSKREDSLRRMDRERPDVIFHAAAMTHVDGCEAHRHEALRDNLEVTKHVVEAANRAHALLVFFSTDYVFNGSKQGEYSETDLPEPMSVYGETKRLAEMFILQRCTRAVIFRLSWLYGLRGRSFPRTLIENTKKNRPLRIVDDQVGRPTYTRDIAQAFRDLLANRPGLLESFQGEIFHLAGDGIASWAEFAAGFFHALGKEGIAIERISSEELKRPARRPHNSVLSILKAREKLGMHLDGWQQSIKEFIDELKAQPLSEHA